MDLAGYVINAVLVEGRSVREVAAAHGVSKTWLYELLARYKQGGEQAIRPGSRRPKSSPARVSDEMEDEIVELRKQLDSDGLDAGAATIQYHLLKRRRGRARACVPSAATIWRVLKRRGFVTAQPQKRPKSSWKRFQADLPNEMWQADVTHWALDNGTEVEILNVEDDHSRLAVASAAFPVVKAADVVETFHHAASQYGLPAALLTDNGAIFTAAYRGGICVMETELLALGVEFRHSRPYHPQTCGKVERFHQTLKKWLTRQPPAHTLKALQAQLDRFSDYYNHTRPHRAIGRKTPHHAFTARTKAAPRRDGTTIPTQFRVRRDKIGETGKVTLRYQTKLHHIAVGRAHAGTPVLLLVADDEVRIITHNGELLRQLKIDPTKNYQPSGKPRGRPRAKP